MRFVKYAVMVFGVLILLVGVAVAVLVAQFKPDEYRGQIAEAIKKSTGREAQLRGSITVQFGWEPVVTVADFSLANIAGGSRPEMLKAARLEVSVALIPLATDRRIEVKKLAIDGVDLLLERLANGEANWSFTPTAAAAPATTSAPSAKKPVTLPTIDSLLLTKTTLTFKDGAKPPRVLALEKLEAGLPRDGSLSLAASGVLDGVVLSAEAKLKSLAAVIAGVEAVPGNLTVKLAGASLSLDGVFGPGAAYDGKVAAQAPALASLLALAGQQGPEPGALALSAQIKLDAAGVTIADGALSLGEGADKLSAKLAGKVGIDGKLDLGITAESANTKLLQRLGAGVPDGVFALRTTLGGTAPLIAAEGLDLKLGDMRAQGRFALERLAPTPKIALDLGIDRFVVAAAPAKAAPTSSGAPAPAPAVEGADGRVIPAMPLPWDMLGKADATVVLRVGALVNGLIELDALQLRMALAGGVLTLSDLEFGFAAGHWAVQAGAKAADRSLTLGLKAEGVDAVALAKAFGASPAVTSKMAIGVEFAGQGADLRALLASSHGIINLDAATGVVSASLFKGSAGGVAKILLAGRSDEDVRMECAVIHAPIQQGVARFATGVVETQKLGLATTGTVNLGNEKLALKIDPSLRDAALQMLAPAVLVGGSMGQPSIEPDRAGLAAGAISAVGGLATGSTLGGLAAGQLLGAITGKNPNESPSTASAAEICANARAGKNVAPVATPASAPGQIAPSAAPRPGSAAPTTQDPVKGLFDMFRKR